MIKKIAVANDVSGLGNCSLAVNLPILSVMGFQPCPIPTALFTNQSCYEVFFTQKCEANFEDYKNAWDANNTDLSGIYSGYFQNGKAILSFIDTFLKDSEVLYINDPVMGDMGKPYSNCDKSLLEAMKKAASLAYVTTPNLTELCMLTDTPYEILGNCEDVYKRLKMAEHMARKLLDRGTKYVVVTGIRDESNYYKIPKLYNIIVSENERDIVSKVLLKENFSGTGDIFSSILAGCIFKGKTISFGVKKAADFVEKAMISTKELEDNLPNDGIYFQPFLTSLVES